MTPRDRAGTIPPGGPSMNRRELLKATLASLVSTFGVDVPAADVRSKNCAVVMVSAELPALAKVGDRIDATVSSIGDARDLDGGVLMQHAAEQVRNRIPDPFVAMNPITLAAAGLSMPPTPAAVGAYVPAVRSVALVSTTVSFGCHRYSSSSGPTCSGAACTEIRVRSCSTWTQ